MNRTITTAIVAVTLSLAAVQAEAGNKINWGAAVAKSVGDAMQSDESLEYQRRRELEEQQIRTLRAQERAANQRNQPQIRSTTCRVVNGLYYCDTF